jgi:hypothetical protein
MNNMTCQYIIAYTLYIRLNIFPHSEPKSGVWKDSAPAVFISLWKIDLSLIWPSIHLRTVLEYEYNDMQRVFSSFDFSRWYFSIKVDAFQSYFSVLFNHCKFGIKQYCKSACLVRYSTHKNSVHINCNSINTVNQLHSPLRKSGDVQTRSYIKDIHHIITRFHCANSSLRNTAVYQHIQAWSTWSIHKQVNCWAK